MESSASSSYQLYSTLRNWNRLHSSASYCNHLQQAAPSLKCKHLRLSAKNYNHLQAAAVNSGQLKSTAINWNPQHSPASYCNHPQQQMQAVINWNMGYIYINVNYGFVFMLCYQITQERVLFGCSWILTF